MKRVGIILREETINEVAKYYVRKELLNVLSNYNIEIICIPIIGKLKTIFNIINSCQGIVLPGGDDVLDNDLNIIDYLYQKNIPTLGICLGMQEMGIYKKSSLNAINDPKHDNNMHKVIINQDSLLFSIIKKREIITNSFHKWIIIKPGLDVGAISDDLKIEAIEDKNKKYFIGVQWHPEKLFNEESRSLFDSFINIL